MTSESPSGRSSEPNFRISLANALPWGDSNPDPMQYFHLPPDINEFLPLARKIALSFSNIPGLDSREIEMHAQEALAAAAQQFDPAKGEFSNYAAQAIRNALRTLHQRQLRHHEHHAYTLNQAVGFSTEGDAIQQTPDTTQDSVIIHVGRAESIAALQRCMAKLPQKHQKVLQAVAKGMNYVEIGLELGVSKQAAHKMAAAALKMLREYLADEGFRGLDSVGLLKSFRRDKPDCVDEFEAHK